MTRIRCRPQGEVGRSPKTAREAPLPGVGAGRRLCQGPSARRPGARQIPPGGPRAAGRPGTPAAGGRERRGPRRPVDGEPSPRWPPRTPNPTPCGLPPRRSHCRLGGRPPSSARCASRTVGGTGARLRSRNHRRNGPGHLGMETALPRKGSITRPAGVLASSPGAPPTDQPTRRPGTSTSPPGKSTWPQRDDRPRLASRASDPGALLRGPPRGKSGSVTVTFLARWQG